MRGGSAPHGEEEGSCSRCSPCTLPQLQKWGCWGWLNAGAGLAMVIMGKPHHLVQGGGLGVHHLQKEIEKVELYLFTAVEQSTSWKQPV